MGHVHGLTSAGLLPSHHRLCAGASWGQAQMADVYIDDFGHVAQVGQSELESGEDPDVDFMIRADDFHANQQIPQSVHNAVRSEVASAVSWTAEISGIDGSVAVPLFRRACCLCLGLLWLAGGATRAEAQSVLGFLVTSFLFRRELLSRFGQVYQRLRKLRVPTRDRSELWQMRLSRPLSCSWWLWRPFAGISCIWLERLMPAPLQECQSGHKCLGWSSRHSAVSARRVVPFLPLQEAFGRCLGDPRENNTDRS